MGISRTERLGAEGHNPLSGIRTTSGAEAVERCKPVYETMQGWRESTVGAKSFSALPANARAYLQRIEALTGVPIAMVSTGPDRTETILVHHPFR